MLYLGTTVLILLDLSYVSRFWTQFEAWLSMQFATPDGLKAAIGTPNVRHHIVCIQNAAAQSELYEKALVDNWANKTPLEAHEFLSKPDVTVTNMSDKVPLPIYTTYLVPGILSAHTLSLALALARTVTKNPTPNPGHNPDPDPL